MDSAIFVENIKLRCNEKGVFPTVACKESGVGTSFITDIKRGQIPSVAKVQMIAEYLGTTVSDLLGEKKGDPVTVSDDEAALDAELISRLCQLTPEELVRVDAFVQGMIATR